jgi:hypothetical protein
MSTHCIFSRASLTDESIVPAGSRCVSKQVRHRAGASPSKHVNEQASRCVTEQLCQRAGASPRNGLESPTLPSCNVGSKFVVLLVG